MNKTENKPMSKPVSLNELHVKFLYKDEPLKATSFRKGKKTP